MKYFDVQVLEQLEIVWKCFMADTDTLSHARIHAHSLQLFWPMN